MQYRAAFSRNGIRKFITKQHKETQKTDLRLSDH